MLDDSFAHAILGMVLIFVFVAIVISLLGLGQYMPLVTSVFTFFLADHIEGFVAGAIAGAFLPFLAGHGVEVEIGGMTFSISFFAIAGAIVQYFLFH